eukprot:5152588-Pyramimonas_sp.AAC.1
MPLLVVRSSAHDPPRPPGLPRPPSPKNHGWCLSGAARTFNEMHGVAPSRRPGITTRRYHQKVCYTTGHAYIFVRSVIHRFSVEDKLT